MSNMLDFFVIHRSVSFHCCFEASVMHVERDMPVCECFNSEDAEFIATNLNPGSCVWKRLALVHVTGGLCSFSDAEFFDTWEEASEALKKKVNKPEIATVFFA